MENINVIVVGGGLAGLTAGAKLAKEGKKVLLIEQHDRPGGCATTFNRKGFTMEVGLHEMDGLHEKDLKTRIFRDLGVFDKVKFLKVPEFYRFVNGRYDIVIPHDPELAKKVLLENFPNEESGISAYFNQLMNYKKLASETKGSLGDFLDSIIENEDLKLVLLGNLGYFSDNPYMMALSYYSVAQGSYYAGGGNFIQGGSQKLSDCLAEIIETNGGKVLLNHHVSEIVMNDKKAIGVIYKSKTENRPITVLSDDIIINASIPNVMDHMMQPEQSQMLKSIFNHFEIGPSILTVYFGFKRSLKEIGSKYYSSFVFDKSVRIQSDVVINNKSGFDTRSFTFIDYSQIDSALAPEGKSVGALCCMDYTSDWEDLDKKMYKAKKEEVAQLFIDRMEKLIPGFRENIEYVEVGTSKTIQRYTLNPKGAVYGFAQTPEYAVAEKINPFENLYFASAWSKFGGGFSGAIYSGYMTAFEIIRKRN